MRDLTALLTVTQNLTDYHRSQANEIAAAHSLSIELRTRQTIAMERIAAALEKANVRTAEIRDALEGQPS